MVTWNEADLRQLMEASEELWNAGDRDGWERLWRTAVPGELVLESPVGSEPKRGFDAARSRVWDEVQPVTIHTRHLIVSGSSVAALTENVLSVDGQIVSVFSIDTYDFDESGNCYERNYFSIPA
jgi:hypothetical protein